LGSHALKWPVGVVFIATNQNLAVEEGCLSHGAPDSPVHTGHVWCDSHVTRSLGSDRWSSAFWARLDVRCASHVTKAVGYRPLEL
jgi:hypothetical protein